MPLDGFSFNGALVEDEMCGVGEMHSSTWPTPGRGQALIYSILTHPSAKDHAWVPKTYTLRV